MYARIYSAGTVITLSKSFTNITSVSTRQKNIKITWQKKKDHQIIRCYKNIA